MSILCLNETIDQLAMKNSVRWYGHALMREDGHALMREDDHVLRREDSHVLRKTLYFVVEGQRTKERPKRTWKKGSLTALKGILSRTMNNKIDLFSINNGR